MLYFHTHSNQTILDFLCDFPFGPHIFQKYENVWDFSGIFVIIDFYHIKNTSHYSSPFKCIHTVLMVCMLSILINFLFAITQKTFCC